MEASFASLIFVGLCCFALISKSEAECCKEAMSVTFTADLSCENFGADRKPEGCHINICANGRRREGYYCGQGKCDLFGCACNGGCLTGNWLESFKEDNERYNVHIIEAHKFEQVLPL